ncbi:MAG: DNA topoisomerase III [Desulfobulbaceae bacterium]|nr:DNA topoisomerase III [Desulfobulbaceae bacterium]
MEKTLIIAEKPSVAADIVKALPGKFTKSKTHYENDDYIVSYAVGHLVSIAYPEDIDPKFQKWDLENLPILPEQFPLTVLPSTKTQYNALSKLIRRKDVTVIVNGCDAGREGELIFKYILKQASTKATATKTIKRLWLQSMTLDAIREGLSHLREDREMIPLEDTALCRSESDWLIGINATRALTGYNSRFGGFIKTPCGRVQTPTLSMLVQREAERREFVPQPYWELLATFSTKDDSYQGLWIEADFKKDTDDSQQKASRIWQQKRAEEIRELCLGKNAVVSESSKESTQRSPLLYDLTSLQREANSRFGFSAKNTLAIAQALYERHKLVTYPRTDSRHLPEDYLESVKKVCEQQKKWQYGQFAAEAISKKYLKKDKRIFNNAKVSDHFAIIPTTGIPGTLSEQELKIYQMIVQRFLAVFFPPAVFHNTKRLSVVDEHTFLTEGKILVEPGWKAIYGSSADDSEVKMLKPIPAGMAVSCSEIENRNNETKPPPRFSEATLLSAMENSGKLIEDEELAEAMKERGLGTPATRAAIIEKLINEKLIVREQRELIPTGKAFELINILKAMKIEELASPELTGEWEYRLNQIIKGGMTREQFMANIRELTGKIVEQIKNFSADNGCERKEAVFSPINGTRFFETPSAYISEDEKVMVRKILGGRVMNIEEITELIRGETIGPMGDFRSKRGKPFTASIRLNNGKVEFLFADSTDQLDLEDIKSSKSLGKSPIDGTDVYETPAAFMSETALEGDREKGLRISKMILGRRIDPDHIEQLLTEGKTQLITGFISKKKRPFDAYLKLDHKGSLSFEFPPRKKKGQ